MAKNIRNVVLAPTAPLWCFVVLAVMTITAITISS